MTRIERAEIVSIPIASAGAWGLSAHLPQHFGFGQLMLIACALLLAQSLVRDLSLLRAARALAAESPRRVAQCMCLESTVGAYGILLGAMLTVSGLEHRVQMAPWQWAGLVFGVLTVGFAIKNLVIAWRPWRLERDIDHLNVVVRLRS